MNLGHFLTPYTRRNSKWMKDLNVRQEAIKILKKKAGKNLFDLACSNFFDLDYNSFLLDTSPKARETKAKNEQLEHHQDKPLLHSEGNNQQN